MTDKIIGSCTIRIVKNEAGGIYPIWDWENMSIAEILCGIELIRMKILLNALGISGTRIGHRVEGMNERINRNISA